MTKYSRDSWFLFISQIITHLSLIPLIIYGTWHHWVIAFIVYFFTGCFGMTMTFHRLLSHKSWKAPRWFEIFGTLCGTYGLTGSSIGWTAIHRQHHHKTDIEGDPHSPEVDGFIKVQWFSMFVTPNPKYAVHLLRDKFHIFLHTYYYHIHVGILVIWLLYDPMLTLAAYLVPACILWNAGSAINTINHLSGYRLHDTKDNSANNFLTGYLMWGEGWHNNHHHDPNNKSFKIKWWEIDIGGWLIERFNTTTIDSNKNTNTT